jgi:hypothetical protein
MVVVLLVFVRGGGEGQGGAQPRHETSSIIWVLKKVCIMVPYP